LSLAVIDSSVLIDVLRRHPPALSLLRALRRERTDLWAPTTVRAEVAGGMREDETRQTSALLRLVNWHPVTVEIADTAAAHARRYRAAYSGIELSDYILAATADDLHARLLTLNVRHFPMFQDLAHAY